MAHRAAPFGSWTPAYQLMAMLMTSGHVSWRPRPVLRCARSLPFLTAGTARVACYLNGRMLRIWAALRPHGVDRRRRTTGQICRIPFGLSLRQAFFLSNQTSEQVGLDRLSQVLIATSSSPSSRIPPSPSFACCSRLIHPPPAWSLRAQTNIVIVAGRRRVQPAALSIKTIALLPAPIWHGIPS